MGRPEYFRARPAHVSAILDQILADPRWAPVIDETRIAAIAALQAASQCSPSRERALIFRAIWLTAAPAAKGFGKTRTFAGEAASAPSTRR